MVTLEMKTSRVVPRKKEQKKEAVTNEPLSVSSIRDESRNLVKTIISRNKAKEFTLSPTLGYSDQETSVSPTSEKVTQQDRKVKLRPIIDTFRQERVKDILIKKKQREKTRIQELEEELITLRSQVTPETSYLPEILEEYERILSTQEIPIYKTSTVDTGIKVVVIPSTTESIVQQLKMIEEERMVESQITTLKVRTMRPTTMPIVNRELRKST